MTPGSTVIAGPHAGDGLLEMRFGLVGGITTLMSRRQRFPLRCTVPLYLDDALPDMAWVYIQNPTGVVGAGDHLDVRIATGAGTRVHVTTPSATKVLRMDGGCASQDITVHVGPGGYVEHVPDPIIPHHGASFDQRLDVHLDDGASYIGSEILAPGRRASGELFEYERLSLRTTIVDARGAELLVDNVVLEPARHDPRARGSFGRCGYCASVVVVGPGVVADDLADRLDDALAPTAAAGVIGGAGRLAGGAGVLVRILAPTSAVAVAAVRSIWSFARGELVGAAPPRSRK